MVRIYSPSSSPSSASGAQLFGGPGFHVPMFSPRPPALDTAAPYTHLDYHDPPPPSHHHSHSPPPPSHRPRPHLSAFGEPMMPLVFVHESAASHLFMDRSHSPPPPPPSIHGHHQPFGSPPPPPTMIQHGRFQQSRKPVSWGPIHSPPAHDRGAPFYGHDYGYHRQPPPPPPSVGHHQYPPPPLHDHGNGYPPQFSRHVIHEPMLSPPPTHHSEAFKLFGRRNHPPPASPSFHGHHHPPPPFHSAHSHGHHPRHEFGGPHGLPKGMRSFPPILEPATPNMFISHGQSPPPPPPPPHLDYDKSTHTSPSSPLHHVGASHYAHQFDRPPALGFEAPHSFMGHFHGSHSPPPPPPPPPPTHSYPPALGSEVPHSLMRHVHGSHSPPPPPPPLTHGHPPALGAKAPHPVMGHAHGSHSPPPPPPPLTHGHPPALGAKAPHPVMGHFHGSNAPPLPPPMHSHNTCSFPFQDQAAAEYCAQHPLEPQEAAEALHHCPREPFTSGMEQQRPHHFPGHVDGMSEGPPREEEKHPLPQHRTGREQHEYYEADGAHHRHEFDAAAGPRSPPPRHRRRPAAPPSMYPFSFCAPLVPAVHLSHAYRPHMAVPVW